MKRRPVKGRNVVGEVRLVARKGKFTPTASYSQRLKACLGHSAIVLVTQKVNAIPSKCPARYVLLSETDHCSGGSEIPYDRSAKRQEVPPHPYKSIHGTKADLLPPQRANNARKSSKDALARADRACSQENDLTELEIQAAVAEEKYARRRRHKTKADRYEYDGKVTTADLKRESRSKEKKRNSHKKSGSTLNRDFKAPNVGSERLTLRQESMPGIFSKGRASAPMERRGLPDLSFSEMAFLSKKRDLNDVRFRGLQSMGQPAKKNVGGAQDVSAYFANPAGPSSAADDPGELHARSVPGLLDRHTERSGPETCNQSKSMAGSIYNAHTAPPGVKSAPSLHESHANDPGKFSGISWSTSPARPVRGGHSAAVASNVNDPAGKSHVRSRQASVHPRSSISNIQIRPTGINTHPPRHYTTASPINEPRKQQNEYTLEDLMHLAELQRRALSVDGDYKTQQKMALPSEDAANLLLPNNTADRGSLNVRLLARPDADLMPKFGYVEAHMQQWDIDDQRIPAESIEQNPERHFYYEAGECHHLSVDAPHAGSSDGHLDQFDYALLSHHTYHHRQVDIGNDYHKAQQAEDFARHAPQHLEHRPIREPADQSFEAVNDVAMGASVGAGTRPQLLRPSCDDLAVEPAFDGFTKPRFLY